MDQARLAINQRIISQEEMIHRNKLKAIENEIKELKKQKKKKYRQLKLAMGRQHENGIRTAEKPVTPELIENRLKPFEDQIKRLQKDYAALKRTELKLTRAASMQSSFNF